MDEELYNTIIDFNSSVNQEETEEEKKKREEKERKKEEEKLLKSIQESQDIEPQETDVTVSSEEILMSDDLFNSVINLEEENSDTDYTVLSPEVSTTRKIQYGARQEPMIAGSVFRLLKAGVSAISPNETFNEAVQRIETERQDEILKDYPEFRGKKEDLTVISGRMGTAIADPVTFFIPWAKVAKAGKLASVATGATVASADAALREKTLYGDVSLGYVGASALMGGASSGIGDLVARRLNLDKKTEKILTIDNEGNKVFKDLNATDMPMIGPLTEKMQETLNEVTESSYTISLPFINSFRDDISFLGEKYTERDLVYSQISKLTTELKTSGNVKKIREIELANSVQSNFPFSVTGSVGQPGTRTLKMSQLDIIKKKKELLDYQKQLPVLQKEIDDVLYVKAPENIAVVGFNSLIEASKAGMLKGSVGSNLTRAMVHEMTRPLVGAGMGGSVALVLSEGESDDVLVNSLMVGAAFGFLNKRIENSSYKLNAKVVSDIQEETSKVIRRNWRTYFKQLLSGSNASKGMAMSPPVQQFTRDSLKIHGTRLEAGDVIGDSVEYLTQSSQDYYRRALYNITGMEEDATVMTAGRLVQQHNMPSKSKHSFLEPGDLQNIKALEMSKKIIALNDSFKDYVGKTGVIFREQEAYGLTQIIDQEVVDRLGIKKAIDILAPSFQTQSINQTGKEISLEVAKTRAKKYLTNSDNIRRQAIVSTDELEKSTVSLIKKAGATDAQNNTVIGSARFFDNKRTLYDQEARAQAKQLFIQDPEFTNIQLFENTIPVAEFSRRYGSSGQGLTKVIQDIKKYYSKFGDIETNKGLQKLIREDVTQVSNTVNSLFKVHGMPSGWRGSETAKSVSLTLQTLLSTTKLTKVALPSLGDLIQVMNNSGFKAAFNSFTLQARQKGLNATKPSASLAQRTTNEYDGMFGRQFTNRRYNGALQKELSDFSMSGTTTYQKTLIKYQERFFEAVQLGRVTRYAREFAFDAGAFRAFDLGKKTKFNDSVKRELSELGLNVEHAKYLNKFNSMDEAYADASGKVLLERAGRKASARDALIPEIGNRRLFSQSNDPVVKFAGSFLSWAQAKSAQTNSLVRKIEDGDARLALTILATLPLYATVRQAQIQMNPNKDYRKEMTQPFESEENFKKFVGDSVMFSGNIPWWVDKIVSNFKYQQNEAIENIYPIVGLIQDFIDGLKKTAGGKPLTGGIEIVEQVLPFAKEITRRESVGEKIGLDSNIYDEALIRDKDIIPRGIYSTGGIVEGKDDVPYTKENPADRVNPNTGLPYSENLNVTEQLTKLGLNK